MNKLIKILLPLLITSINVYSLYALNLTVSDPRHSFSRYSGTIENMTLEVHPQGTFIEAGIYLTFSAYGSPYTSATDTLEAVLEFELPDKAFINGMWLFMSDTTYVEARLMDKWSAGFIYEGIVQRRMDPSILYKKTAGGSYAIKVFPMYGNSTRTVKINCLLPGTWTKDEVYTKLPLNFINVSYKKPQIVRVHAYPDNQFTFPVFRDNYGVQFKDNLNKRFGYSKLAEVNTDTAKASVISFTHDFQDGVFVSLSEFGDEGYYQLVVDPGKSTVAKNPKRISVLFDYDKNKSNITPGEVYIALKNIMYKYLTPNDSFNIFISNKQIFQLSERWLSCDSINMEGAFSIIMNGNKTGTETNLPELLYRAVEWTDMNADTAIILLIADSDAHGMLDTANKIGTKTMSLINNKIQFNVCSFVQKNWITNFISSMAVTGNDYLYWNLVKLTRGTFNKIQENGNILVSFINNAFNAIIGGYEDINFSTSISDGYLYDKLYPQGKVDITENKTIIEYGKFKGEPPMRIDINGYYRKVHYNNSWKFTPDTNQPQYKNKSIWGATRLRDMELASNEAYMQIYDIINTSLEYGVLSVWTAFLAVDTDTLHDIEEDEDYDVPVELVYFSGYARDNSIDLYWATASEKNNAGFYLERRINDAESNWSEITFVSGNGTCTDMKYYSFSDREVKPGTSYQYRLRQMDRDGSFSIGKTIVTVKYDKSLNLTMEQNSPNPFREGTTIHFTLPEESFVNLEISDIYGNSVVTFYNQMLPKNDYEIVWNGFKSNSEAAPNGVYLCKLSACGTSRVIKMILNR